MAINRDLVVSRLDDPALAGPDLGEVLRDGPGDEHVRRRVLRDVPRDRAEERRPSAGEALVPHDDEVEALLVGRRNDLLGRIALEDDHADLRALADGLRGVAEDELTGLRMTDE